MNRGPFIIIIIIIIIIPLLAQNLIILSRPVGEAKAGCRGWRFFFPPALPDRWCARTPSYAATTTIHSLPTSLHPVFLPFDVILTQHTAFFAIKPTSCINFTNLFRHETTCMTPGQNVHKDSSERKKTLVNITLHCKQIETGETLTKIYPYLIFR